MGAVASLKGDGGSKKWQLRQWLVKGGKGGDIGNRKLQAAYSSKT